MRVTKYKTKLIDNRRVELVKDLCNNYPEMDNKFNSPEHIAKFAKDYLRMQEEPEEHMYMLCFNSKLKLNGVFEISHGNVNSSIVGTREVFQKELLGNAVSIALVHNHPSGDCTPSREDIVVTERLVDAGKIIGVQVLDHIVIGKSFASLKEKGYI